MSETNKYFMFVRFFGRKGKDKMSIPHPRQQFFGQERKERKHPPRLLEEDQAGAGFYLLDVCSYSERSATLALAA